MILERKKQIDEANNLREEKQIDEENREEKKKMCI